MELYEFSLLEFCRGEWYCISALQYQCVQFPAPDPEIVSQISFTLGFYVARWANMWASEGPIAVCTFQRGPGTMTKFALASAALYKDRSAHLSQVAMPPPASPQSPPAAAMKSEERCS